VNQLGNPQCATLGSPGGCNSEIWADFIKFTHEGEFDRV
jgi:hypothetical protein